MVVYKFIVESKVASRQVLIDLYRNLFKTGCLNSTQLILRKKSTTTNSLEDRAESDYQISDDSDLELNTEDLRNVSRLTPNQFKHYHGLPPDMPYKDLIHKRHRYAAYGSASGENPRIMWPSRSTILAMEEEEKEEGSKALIERLKEVQMEQEAAEEEKLERRKRIEQNMAQMPKWIAEYWQKQTQAHKEAAVRAAKKEALLEEARDYFGYKVQANDPKFQQMVEEKEEKEKAEAKKRKKEDKAKKLAARMAQEMAKVSKSAEKASS
ncbi:growth arrest and DNA damage-inducible proteins-interacting protein 1 [Plakobranchus ocellatus]|uniref:Large ribosomal subunit protein mL64 n=1 Tax=Plakobranchus ocellatus TaxID=259542 RepID=A0AAV3Z6U9_9GAST|nr:growth arrest and DNA damage-inducible proteins-interacting protein 1 [Plakobranchus ocellatus]